MKKTYKAPDVACRLSRTVMPLDKYMEGQRETQCPYCLFKWSYNIYDHPTHYVHNQYERLYRCGKCDHHVSIRTEGQMRKVVYENPDTQMVAVLSDGRRLALI